VWRRAALAAVLVGVVTVFVVPRLGRPDAQAPAGVSFECRDIVAMAKSSEPHLPETIFIPDQTPHIEEAVARPHPLLETIKPLGRYSERAFLHFCPRRDNAIPFHPAFVDGKPLKIGFSAKLSARNPRNLSGRQFANVCNLYSRVSEIFRVASKGSVQSFSHIWFGLSGARHWLKR